MMRLTITLTYFALSILNTYSQNSFPDTGNVEINSGSLTVQTDSWKSSLITLKDTHYSPSKIYQFQIEANGLKIRENNIVNYNFTSDGDFLVRNGGLGIGTANPQAKLHLNTSSHGDAIQFQASYWTEQQYSLGINESATFFLKDKFNDVERLTLSRQGNIGINTSDPEQKLHIVGANTSIQVRLGRNGTNSGIVDFGVDQEGLHYWMGGFDSQEEFFIGSNGNIGVGTDIPSHKLDVKGTIHSQEVLVDLNVEGPDYVFEEDYPLQDLISLEQYLKDNKHLPEVPSAGDMERDGINVGEMEMLLLKKVEELTLHLIRQEKEIQKLKKGLNEKD